MPGLLESNFRALMGLLGQLGGEDTPTTPKPLLHPSQTQQMEDIYSYDYGVSKRQLVKNVIPRHEMKGFEPDPWRSTASPPPNPKEVSTGYGPGQYTYSTLLTLDTSTMSKSLKSFYDELMVELKKSMEEKRTPGRWGKEYAYSDPTHKNKLEGTLKWGLEGPPDKQKELYYDLGEMILDTKIDIMNNRRNTATNEARDAYVGKKTLKLSRYHDPLNWNNKDIKDVHTLLGLWYGNKKKNLNDIYANKVIQESYGDFNVELGRLMGDIEPARPKPERSGDIPIPSRGTQTLLGDVQTPIRKPAPPLRPITP